MFDIEQRYSDYNDSLTKESICMASSDRKKVEGVSVNIGEQVFSGWHIRTLAYIMGMGERQEVRGPTQTILPSQQLESIVKKMPDGAFVKGKGTDAVYTRVGVELAFEGMDFVDGLNYSVERFEYAQNMLL